MNKLWTKNFCLVTFASFMGSAGAIMGGFALSFFIFDETGSTLASALIIAIRLIPYIFIPIVVSPIMDRLPRKVFLVGGDIVNGIIYMAMGLWLIFFEFSYIGYLTVSIFLACLGSVDELAFTSIYPDLIPKGAEQKGYSVSSMLYPVLNVVLMPLSAVLLDTVGVPMLLISQGALSILAAVTESFIKLDKQKTPKREKYSLKEWGADIKEAASFLKKGKGLRSIFEYMAVTNGFASGYGPILIAFFRSAPGFTAAMYSFFSVVEFAGRSIGSALQYKIRIPKEKKFGIVFFVYMLYETMDMCLMWIPYPLMLVNRGLCGFFGSNSAILRNAAVQVYIPENLRSRINAFNSMLMMLAGSVLTLAVGALGEIVDYRVCVTICGILAMLACIALIWMRRKDVRKVYEWERQRY